jgi:TusA-related sulfurtransferase
MIVTEIYRGSGLGNQIWNLVVSRILAQKHGYKWGVKKSTPFKAKNFMPNFYFGEEVIGGNTPREGQPPASLPVGITNYIRERNDPLPQCGHSGIFFDDNLWNNLPDNSKLDGLFQCLTYINEYKDDIRKWLSHNVDVQTYSDEDTCVIHFRGGEYLITASWCPPEFYENARDKMLEINPNMNFVVVTDDPENANKFIPWAKVVGATTLEEQEDIEQGTGFFKYKGGNIGVDWSILHNARHVIMSASTFSFWPVWTSKVVENVIAPKYWFDYKTSDGWWRGDDMIVPEWKYLDTQGVLNTGSECQTEYDLYKGSRPYYNTIR